MSYSQLANLLFFTLGIAFYLFIIFSISIRIVKNELNKIKQYFIKKMKQVEIIVVHR